MADLEDFFSDSEGFAGLSKEEGESEASLSATVVDVSTRFRLDLDTRLRERTTCSEVIRVGGASFGFGPRLTRGKAREGSTVVLHPVLKQIFKDYKKNLSHYYTIMFTY